MAPLRLLPAPITTCWRLLGCLPLVLSGLVLEPRGSRADTAPSDTVQWQLMPTSTRSERSAGESPAAPLWQLMPGTKTPAAAQPPVWRDGEDRATANQSASSAPVQWVVLDPQQNQQLEQTVRTSFAAEPMARVRFRGPKPLPFHSVSRNITYGETLYPEMGFWIPSVFRQSADYRFTFTYQLLGNPTNGATPDWRNWEDFWNQCSDGQYLAEVTPLIWGPLSVGVNYSQQESFVGDRSDGSFEQGGQAVGFQVKSNLSSNIGAGVVGFNLWNPYGKGGPNGSYPAPGEEIQADLGRTYLFMGSAACRPARAGAARPGWPG